MAFTCTKRDRIFLSHSGNSEIICIMQKFGVVEVEGVHLYTKDSSVSGIFWTFAMVPTPPYSTLGAGEFTTISTKHNLHKTFSIFRVWGIGGRRRYLYKIPNRMAYTIYQLIIRVYLHLRWKCASFNVSAASSMEQRALYSTANSLFTKYCL